MFALLALVLVLRALVTPCSGHGSSEEDGHHHHEPHLLTSRSHNEEKDHIELHMREVTGQAVAHLPEDELQFLYFKMHDSDSNNKLDGVELIHSILHWHVEEHKAMVPEGGGEGTTRVFDHGELASMVDPIMASDDRNWDGFIDYSEFIAGQRSRGF